MVAGRHWLLNNRGITELEAFPAGFLHGYGVYTTFRWPESMVWLERHRQRLVIDAHMLGMIWRWEWTNIIAHLENLLQDTACVARLSVVGHAPGGYADFIEQDRISARLFLSVRAKPPGSTSGYRLKTVAQSRNLPLVKTIGLADTMLTRRQARQAGFDDILLLNGNAHVTESSTANVFVLQAGQLFTPVPDRDGCLPGITRLRVLEQAKILGMPVVQNEPLSQKALWQADGVFLSNAVHGIWPVQQIDTHRVPWLESARTVFESLAPCVKPPDGLD